MNEKQIKAMLGKMTGTEIACLITSVNALQALKKSYGKTPPNTLDLCNKLKGMSTELANIIINIVNGHPSRAEVL